MSHPLHPFHEDHPHFDFALELLCLLPRFPAGVTLEQAGQDLGGVGPDDMDGLIDRLAERHGVFVGRDCGDYWIPRHQWTKAQAVGESYWNDVYGGGDVAMKEAA